MINKLMVGLVVLLAIFNVYMWRGLNWSRSISVNGYAESKVSNEIAKFAIGVTSLQEKKESAVEEVKTKIVAIVEAVKGIGVDPADIKTSQINVYQMQEGYPDGGVVGGGSFMEPNKIKLGQWNANVTIEVTLRDTEKAGAFADTVNLSGATELNGPNFQLDNSKKFTDDLIDEAIANAKVKAEVMAKSTGARLGKVMSVSEDFSVNPTPMYDSGMMAKSELVMPAEVGTSTVSKTVMVTWALK